MEEAVINSDAKIELMEIGLLMCKTGLSNKFVAAAVESAFKFEDIYYLMKLWIDEDDNAERKEIAQDIQYLVNDYVKNERSKRVYIHFDDVTSITKNIKEFKNALRLKVEEAGGVVTLSKKTGIPQPSLSRFFNSTSIPHRVTLLKIAKALSLKQVEIAVL